MRITANSTANITIDLHHHDYINLLFLIPKHNIIYLFPAEKTLPLFNSTIRVSLTDVNVFTREDMCFSINLKSESPYTFLPVKRPVQEINPSSSCVST